MTTAHGLDFTRTEAARFSFPLSIPANGTASLLIIGNALESSEANSGPVIVTGILTFFISLGTMTVLMRMIRAVSFLPL